MTRRSVARPRGAHRSAPDPIEAPKRRRTGASNSRRVPLHAADTGAYAQATRPAAATSRRRRVLARIGGIGLRLGIACGFVYAIMIGLREGYEYATTSPRFEVRGLIYTPTSHVSEKHLRELLGILPGTNILSLDLDALAKRVADDPWVARAQVVRVLPDTLEVRVVEHVPVAVLLAGELLLLDEAGVPFKALGNGERGTLPVVTGIERIDLLRSPAAARTRIDRALAVLADYREKQRPRLGEIHVDEAGAVTLYTAELGTELRLGRGTVSPALARYDALRAALGDESEKLAVAHLDVTNAGSSGDRVVASFFPTAAVPSFVTRAEARTRALAEEAERATQDPKTKSGRRSLHTASAAGRRARLPRYE